MKSTSIFLLSSVLLLFWLQITQSIVTEKQFVPLQHLVLYRFKKDTPPLQIYTIENMLHSLQFKIPGILQFSIGKPFEANQAELYQMGSSTLFANADAYEKFLTNAEYKKVETYISLFVDPNNGTLIFSYEFAGY